MILEHKSLKLFGQQLFEKAIIQPPLQLPNPMPDEACFIYVLDGKAEVLSETERLALQAKEAVLLKCGNYSARLKLENKDSKYQAIVIHLVPEVLEKIYANEVPSFLKQKGGNRPMKLPILKKDALLSKYIDGILFYFENPGLATEELLILKIKELFMLLSHTGNSEQIEQILSNLFAPQSFSLREVVEAHLYEDISVGELAQLCGLSLSSFKRKFKEVYKESTAGYLRRKKLEKAAELLLATQENISQIAYESGFNDLAHFSRCFKLNFGKTPTQYRMNQMDNQLSHVN